MRVHFIHAKEFWFRSHKPATKIREEKASIEEVQNALIAFTSIEEGDLTNVENIVDTFIADLKRLVESLKPNAIVIYPYAHLSSKLAPPSEAIRVLSIIYDRTRKELASNVEHILKAPFGWYKEFRLHCYGHPMSELSRTYSGHKEYSGEECFSIHRFLESINLKPIFKEVYDRWGYTRDTGIYLLQLNSMIGMIQSYSRDRLSLMRSKSCNEDTVLTQSNDTDLPLLVYSERGLHFYVTHEKEVLDLLKTMFKTINVEIQGKTLLVNDKGIGKCDDGKCIISLEKTLATRLYIELEKAQKSGGTPLLECWLTPSNIYLASATGLKTENDYLKNLLIELAANPNLRIYGDLRNVRLGKKLREAGKLWSHFTVIVGERDLRSETLTVREREHGEQLSLTKEDFIDMIREYSAKCGYGIGFRKLIE